MESTKFDLGKTVEKLGLWIVGLLAIVCSFFLSAVSLMHTTNIDNVKAGEGVNTIIYHIKEAIESVSYYNDNLFINLLVLAEMLLIFLALAQCLKPIRVRRLALFIFLWTFVLGTVWVLSSQAAPSEDSGTVTSAAWAFAEGDYSKLRDLRYFKNYSFQLGYVLFNECIIRFIQAFRHMDNLMPLEVLNAVFLGVINLFVLLINDQIFKDHRVNLLTTLLLALSSAPIISCSFVYGIYPGMMFAVIAIYCEIRYLKENKLLFAALSVVSMMLAVMIKSNYLIWLIAAVLIVLGLFFRRKHYLRDAGYLAVMLVLALSIQPLVCRHYARVGETDLGDAIPYTSWIAMGLNESDIAPGWYNYMFTVRNFEESNFDAKEAGSRSRAVIKERVQFFLHHSQYTNDFFYFKVTSQWNETSYQSIWNNVVRYQYKDKNALADWVCNTGKGTVKLLMDYFAQLVFFAFCAGCVQLLRRREFLAVPFPVIFLGGFFYQLISEGKSQYILPYFIVMTGFAAFGTVALFDLVLRYIPDDSFFGKLLKPVPAAAVAGAAAAEAAAPAEAGSADKAPAAEPESGEKSPEKENK